MSKSFYQLLINPMIWTLSLAATAAQSQTPTVSYATWKGNAKASYSIVHDDFGDVTTAGITKYADTIAWNRGIKFCFGAITAVCDNNDWSDAQRMIGHGHEIINHSHSHRCAESRGWCSPVYAPSEYGVELDGSTNLIETGAKQRPRFFIHPYDVHTEGVLDRLRSLGYLGARSGAQGVLNDIDFKDFFKLNYFVFDPTSNLALLNQAVETAVAAGGYAMRELHGVQDASWAAVSEADYRAHLNLVKSQVDRGNLWVATPSEAITYKIQRDVYTPSVTFDTASKTLTIRFVGTPPISTSLFKTPVTINVDLNGLRLLGNLKARQGNDSLGLKVTAARITLEAYPHKGTVTIQAERSQGCEPNCPPPACEGDGKLKAQIWKNLSLKKWKMEDLLTDSRYPNTPSLTEELSLASFSRGDQGDKYGERVYGYIVPKVTGDYTFGVTGDDDVHLYLSTNDNPATKRLVASFAGYTKSTELTKFPTQKSAPIRLEQGRFYYVELLHLGTTGTNRYAVYWKTPTVDSFALITRNYLSSKTCVASPITQGRVTLSGTQQGQATLLDWAISQVDESAAYTVERLDPNGRFTPIGDAAHARFEDLNPVNGLNIYRVRYTDAYGQVQHTPPTQIYFTENPNIYLAPNPAEHQVWVDLKEWNNVPVTIFVYDMRGAELQRVDAIAGDAPYGLDLSRIAQTGQYMIRVQSATGKFATKQLLIQR